MKNLDDVHCVRNEKELIDVEESFTMSINGSFKLDLSFFVTLPPLLWEAAIKTTRIELELLTNVNMTLFYGKGVRGGITRAICHCAEANIKHMYDYDKYTKVLNLDFNNMYGNCLIQLIFTEDLNLLNIYQCLHLALP